MSDGTPIYCRLDKTVAEYRALLHDLYWSHGLSQAAISKRLGTHLSTIEHHFKRFDIPTRTFSESTCLRFYKNASLSDEQHQILDGLLLGDGHLDGGVASARLTYGCKFKETLADIAASFSNLSFSAPWCSKRGNWHFKSLSYADLLAERARWYDGRRKLIPADVRLTPLSCYWWFVGDGYQVDYGIKFCTDCFTNGDLQILIDKLQELGFESHITPYRGRLHIKSRSAVKMLEWMRGGRAVAAQYLYKWSSHRRQRIERVKPLSPSRGVLEREIATTSAVVLSRRYRVSPHTIKQWLEAAGLRNPRREQFYRERVCR